MSHKGVRIFASARLRSVSALKKGKLDKALLVALALIKKNTHTRTHTHTHTQTRARARNLIAALARDFSASKRKGMEVWGHARHDVVRHTTWLFANLTRRVCADGIKIPSV